MSEKIQKQIDNLVAIYMREKCEIPDGLEIRVELQELRALLSELRERDEQLAAVTKERDEIADKLDNVCGQLEQARRFGIRTADLKTRAEAAESQLAGLKEVLQRYRRARGLAFGRVAYDPRDPKNHEMVAWAEVLALLAQPAKEVGDGK